MLPTAALQDHEHARGCDAAIAANIRGGECRVIARAAAWRIGRSAGDGAAVIETFITPAMLWILV